MLRPIKRLGQNFLVDPNTIRKIVASLQAPPDAHVVEIGPGQGALTGLLVERFAHVTALEVDERAVELLQQTVPGLDVRHQDVLEADWAALAAEHDAPLYVIGNLPYYITSPIVFALLEARAHIAEAVLMMQLEVAQRIASAPGSKTYGIPSVLVQLYAHPELLFRVSRNVFHPKPDVTSAILRLTFGQDEPEVDYGRLREVVRTAFGQRRKTLRNSLKPIAETAGHAVPEAWAGLRPERLAPADFVALTHALT